ncbi:MAG: hypothetical protein JSR45_14260 [Proteobacteria bacterium]|nr:hypothetical protein [Pseudomonadota bacterium]
MALTPKGPVAVWGGDDPVGTAELAMRRFGLDTRLHGVAKPAEAMDYARKRGAVAVAALDPANPWWARLIAEPKLRAFGLLRGPRVATLCLAELVQEPEGDDLTLWATDAAQSAGVIETELGRAGFAGELMWSGAGLKLFGLAGYVQRDDPRLLAAPGRLSGVIGVIPNAS